MKPEKNRPVWLTRDFEARFQEAFGREMTQEERKFFGLELSSSSKDDRPNGKESR